MSSQAWPDVPIVIGGYVDEARRAGIARALLSSPDQDVFVQEAWSPRFYGVPGEAQTSCVRLHAFLRHFEASAARGATAGTAAEAAAAAGDGSARGAPYSYLSQACYEAADAGSVQIRIDPAAATTPKPHDTLPQLFRAAAFQVACLWMAPTDVESNTHYDADDNLLVVLAGSKHVRLAAPGCRSIDRPRDVAAAGHHTRTRLFDFAGSGSGGDAGAACPRIVALPRVPLESAAAAAAAATGDDDVASAAGSTTGVDAAVYEAVVAAGDALVIPEGWWHNVQSTAGCIAVNFWYSGRAADLRAAPAPAKPYLLRQLLMAMAAEEAARTVTARRQLSLAALRTAYAASSSPATSGTPAAVDLHPTLQSMACPLVGCGIMAGALHVAATQRGGASGPLSPSASTASSHTLPPQALAASAPTAGEGCACTAVGFIEAVAAAVARLADAAARPSPVSSGGVLLAMEAVSQGVCHLLSCLRGQALHAVLLLLLHGWAGAAPVTPTGAATAPATAVPLSCGEASLQALFLALQRPSLQPDGSAVEQCMADAFEEEGPLQQAEEVEGMLDSAPSLPPWAVWLRSARTAGIAYGTDIFYELGAAAAPAAGCDATSSSSGGAASADDDASMAPSRRAPTTLELVGGALSEAQAAGLRRAIAAVMYEHLATLS